jgi:phosphonate ABC transporter ATP-binding protein/phosphonate ABC transporter permease subunit PhnE
MLRLENLEKQYQTGDLALKSINIEIPRGQVMALIGPSGAGKSTLIRCVNRLVEPTSGKVYLGDLELTHLGSSQLRRARRRMGMIFQEYALVERLSVMENVLSGRLGYVGFWRSFLRKFPQSDIDEAFNLLERVGLDHMANKRADELSGGQRQRVGICRALIQNPDLLLVDEPTASLDPKTSRQIMRLICELCDERQLAAIINIHDVLLAQMFARRVVGLQLGKIVYDGPPEDEARLLNQPAISRRWQRPPFITNPTLRWGLWVGVAIYLALALGTMEVDWTRVTEGATRGKRFIMAFFPPDFMSRWDSIEEGILESLWMTITSTVIGILLSIPVGLGAARNLSYRPVYLFCRGILAVSRTFPEIILAIFFVKLFGFGPFAGFLALSVGTIGFYGKLLAEDIEDMDPVQAEAIKSVGASWLQWLNYAVQPQVMPRMIGLGIYRLDINFRESAVVGIVGGGGIGATLLTSFDRYEFDSAAAILLVIIGIVMVMEYSSGYIRRWVQ